MEKATVPCLWILGRHDKYISCDSVLEKVRVPSNAQLFILEKSGHLGFIEEEETSLKIMTDFIEKLEKLNSKSLVVQVIYCIFQGRINLLPDWIETSVIQYIPGDIRL